MSRLIFCIIIGVFALFAGLHATNYSNKNSNVDKSVLYEKYAKQYLDKAEKYEKKADKATSGKLQDYYLSLAENYRASAEQKFSIAKAYRNSDQELLEEAQSKYKQLTETRNQIYSKKESKKDNSKSLSKEEQISKLEKQLTKLQSEIDKLKE